MAVPLFLFVIGYGSVSPAVYGCCRICLCSGIRTDLFTDILPSDGKDGQVFSRQYQKAGSRAAFLKAGRRPSCSPFPCFPGGKANFSSFSQNNADGTDIYLPYPHNKSELHYNEKTREYEYKEYGKAHVDPLDGNKVLSFDNVILQNTGWSLCKYNDGTPDPNGYMIYDVINEGSGYYFTKGRCIGIRWKKTSETAITKYFDKETGEELKLNTGKTYITLVPNDKWAELKFN